MQTFLQPASLIRESLQVISCCMSSRLDLDVDTQLFIHSDVDFPVYGTEIPTVEPLA